MNVRSIFRRNFDSNKEFFHSRAKNFESKSMNFLPREKWESGEIPEIVITPEDYGDDLERLEFGSPKLKRKSAIRISGKR